MTVCYNWLLQLPKQELKARGSQQIKGSIPIDMALDGKQIKVAEKKLVQFQCINFDVENFQNQSSIFLLFIYFLPFSDCPIKIY